MSEDEARAKLVYFVTEYLQRTGASEYFPSMSPTEFAETMPDDLVEEFSDWVVDHARDD